MSDHQHRQYMLLAAKAQADAATRGELNQLELLQTAQGCAKARWLRKVEG